MGEELGTLTDKRYKDDYKDALFNKSDATIQKEYAEAMGWDANLVKNENGNKATYIDQQGNEVKLSDDVARQYLAEQAALKAKFNGISGNTIQTGTITYRYKLN
jgi:hypothetical protein